MMGGVCLSVYLSVARLDLNREWKGLRSPGWKHMTRVIREPIYRSNGKGQGHRVKVKKSRRDSRVAPSRFAVTPLNATAPHRRREMCTLLSAQPLIL